MADVSWERWLGRDWEGSQPAARCGVRCRRPIKEFGGQTGSTHLPPYSFEHPDVFDLAGDCQALAIVDAGLWRGCRVVEGSKSQTMCHCGLNRLETHCASLLQGNVKARRTTASESPASHLVVVRDGCFGRVVLPTPDQHAAGEQTCSSLARLQFGNTLIRPLGAPQVSCARPKLYSVQSSLRIGYKAPPDKVFHPPPRRMWLSLAPCNGRPPRSWGRHPASPWRNWWRRPCIGAWARRGL